MPPEFKADGKHRNMPLWGKAARAPGRSLFGRPACQVLVVPFPEADVAVSIPGQQHCCWPGPQELAGTVYVGQRL